MNVGLELTMVKIIVTKAGMYGVENDEKKENEISFVWVGEATPIMLVNIQILQMVVRYLYQTIHIKDCQMK